MYVFRCPKCLRALPGFRPDKCDCGHGLPVIDGVYQFTDDAPIAIGDHELRWLGYEKVGENYESAYALAYKQGHFGIFGSAARLLAGMLDRTPLFWICAAWARRPFLWQWRTSRQLLSTSHKE